MEEILENHTNLDLVEPIILTNQIYAVLRLNNISIPGSRTTKEKAFINKGSRTGAKSSKLHKKASKSIRQYKEKTTFNCKKTNKEFSIQGGTYDLITRCQKTLARNRKYIQKNPSKRERNENNVHALEIKNAHYI